MESKTQVQLPLCDMLQVAGAMVINGLKSLFTRRILSFLAMERLLISKKPLRLMK
nr:hypothetical protein [uncultured Prevotella sp.]